MEIGFSEVLWTLVFVFFEFCRAANTSFTPTYQIWKAGDDVTFRSTPETHIVPLGDVTNFVDILWLNSSTSSISIRWHISSKYKLNGYYTTTTVEYFPEGGRFTSHPLPHDLREYTFSNLNSNTLYTICVNIEEVYGTRNESKTVHTNCIKINTVKYIRRESVVAMLVTLSYYLFMGLLGYTQWRRRLWDIRRRNRARSTGDNCCTTSTTAAMRWKDLAEREKLCSNNPGCSIEDAER